VEFLIVAGIAVSLRALWPGPSKEAADDDEWIG
jgi:hypothetical protein